MSPCLQPLRRDRGDKCGPPQQNNLDFQEKSALSSFATFILCTFLALTGAQEEGKWDLRPSVCPSVLPCAFKLCRSYQTVQLSLKGCGKGMGGLWEGVGRCGKGMGREASK